MHCSPLKLRLSAVTVLLAVLAGCASPPNKAPVEDRKPARPAAKVPAPTTTATASDAANASATPADAPRPLPGAENAGKPGYYTVKPGDTMIRIGLDNGQNWRDIVRWNAIENPNLIEVGQVLRVVPPGQDAAVATTRPVAAPKVEARPLDGKPAPAASAAAGGASAVPGAASAGVTAGASAGASAGTATAPPASSAQGAASAASAPSAPAVVAREADDDVNWAWPSAGTVSAGFDEGRHKGLAFTGKAGDPVLAAADGRVVYAGSGLRGYGNLVIVKHNNTYLTAYAHNQALLVKEDQAVRRGQKIAEMGSSDADRVQLHFEIRRQGKPIDPSRLLPAR